MSDSDLIPWSDEPSNGPLLDAIAAGAPVNGHVLLRRDGRLVPAEEARLDDWLDLGAQFDDFEEVAVDGGF